MPLLSEEPALRKELMPPSRDHVCFKAQEYRTPSLAQMLDSGLIRTERWEERWEERWKNAAERCRTLQNAGKNAEKNAAKRWEERWKA